MRIILSAAIAAVLSATLGATAQQDMGRLALTSQQRVTVDLQNATLTDTLQALERTGGVDIRIADDVRETVPMTVRFTDARFGDVFMFVLTNAKLYYRYDGNTVVITAKRPKWER